MRVLLTGGTGEVGRAAVAVLAEDGHELTVIGRSADVEIQDAAYVQCDINDYDSLERVVDGHEAVVHLAAHNTPIGKPGREVFRVNDLGTFNVFEAAAEAGIRRVVGASSINALGYYFGDRGVPISYFPIDEDHPELATDAYSFSKQVMEDIGRYFWDRDGISSVMLRLPAVIEHRHILQNDDHYATYDASLIRRLLDLSDAERVAELTRIRTAFDEFRRANRLDKGRRGESAPASGFGLTPDEAEFMEHQANLFTYVDELDSAQSILKGLTAEYEGSHPLFINARKNDLGLPVSEVAKLYAPDEIEIRPSRPGDDTIVSIDRARELIGYEPEWEITGMLAGSAYRRSIR